MHDHFYLPPLMQVYPVCPLLISIAFSRYDFKRQEGCRRIEITGFRATSQNVNLRSLCEITLRLIGNRDHHRVQLRTLVRDVNRELFPPFVYLRTPLAKRDIF